MPRMPLSTNISENEEHRPTLLSLRDITVLHSDTPIIEHIDLDLNRGEILTVIGPNGAGKSTLIKTALGIIRPDSGRVFCQAGTTIGYVPQSVTLDPTLPLTVRRFLQLCLRVENGTLEKVLNRVNAGAIIESSMHDISGGELRRVLLARALLRTPDILILDEPTAGVDINGQSVLYQLIQQIRDDFDCGILLVSHDLHIVMAATDRVLCLNRHLCCSGRPEQVQEHPEYLAIFGHNAATMGVYRHHHDHEHNLHGEVCDHD